MSEVSGFLRSRTGCRDKVTMPASAVPQWNLVTVSLFVSLALGYLLASVLNRLRTVTPTAETSPTTRSWRVPDASPANERSPYTISDTRPNVILAIADDLGYNDVGYGSLDLYACTPNLDIMRHNGMELSSLYAAPLCTPSRAALLTAQYPIALGMQHWQLEAAAPYSLDSNTATMGELFQRQGYATALVGKWHLGHFTAAVLPTRRGFERFYGFYSGGENYFTRISEEACAPVTNVSASQDSSKIDDKSECFWDAMEDERHADLEASVSSKTHSTYAFSLRASDFIARQGNLSQGGLAQPFLLVLALPNSHVPLLAPATIFKTHDAILRQIPNNQRRTFAALTILWDEAIGNVSIASELHLTERPTLWVILSDNGAAIDGGGNNWPLRGGKKYLYEGGVKVRGLIYSTSYELVPEARRGATYTSLMHLVDILPTLLLGVLSNDDGAHGLIDIDGVNHWAYLRDGFGEEPRSEILLNIDYLDSNLEYLGYLRAAIISCVPLQANKNQLDVTKTVRTPEGVKTCFKGLFNVEEARAGSIVLERDHVSLHSGFLVCNTTGSVHYNPTDSQSICCFRALQSHC